MHTCTTVSVFTLVTFLLLEAMVDCKLIISPPKLESQSSKDVWFYIPDSDQPQNFTLICQGSGPSEKYQWFKNGQPFEVDGSHVIWQQAGWSGNITFLQPTVDDKGYYQCSISNSYGVVRSNVFNVQVGVLHHFDTRPVKEVYAEVGQPLTLRCTKPYGVPAPTIFWLYKDTKNKNAMDSIHSKHITIDGDGNLQFSHVSPMDASANVIYQCAATSPVLHGGFRAGDEYRLLLKRTHSSGRQPTPIKLLWKTPSKIQATTGRNLKLSCIFSGRPLPTVEWTKKGSKLNKNRVTKRNHGKTLLIHNVSDADKGMYICNANGYLQYEIFVNVSSEPQWIYGPPTDVRLRENSKAKLHCQVRGEPRPIIRWYKNGERMMDFSLRSRRLVSASGETLILLHVQHDVDTAVYQCNASNPFGYVFANTFIEVLAHAPRFVNADNEAVHAVTGADVHLDCNVEAAPKAKIKWTQYRKDNKATINSTQRGFKLLSNNSLLVERVTIQDAGVYVCTAENKYGRSAVKRQLNVYARRRVGINELEFSSRRSQIRDLTVAGICIILSLSSVIIVLMCIVYGKRGGVYPVRQMEALRHNRKLDDKVTVMECQSDTDSTAESF